MSFTEHESVRKGIRTEYLGPSRILEDHMTAQQAWQRNEAAPSTAYKVGRLTVEPDLLSKVVEQLGQETGLTILGLRGNTLGNQLELESNQGASPFLEYFLNVCGQRFAEFVKEDLRQIVPDYEPDTLQEIYGGPYQLAEGNDWHRDWLHGRGLTYTVTVIGNPTVFAIGKFLQSDFKGSQRDMFDGPEPEDTFTPELGDIIVHHDKAGLHRAPSKGHNGKMRVFASISALAAFTSLENNM